MHSLIAKETEGGDSLLVEGSLFPFTRHKNYGSLIALIQDWKHRFPFLVKETVYNDIAILFNLAAKGFLDQHSVRHLFRLVLGLNTGYNNLLHRLTLNSYERHSFLKLLPTHLIFPFHSKPVLGCLMGVSLKNSQEVVNIESFYALFSKAFPEYQIVPGSGYIHPTHSSSIALLYFEIEKREQESFSNDEIQRVRKVLRGKITGDLPRLTRRVFMPRNQEEVYKNILLLSQEIRSTRDVPHLMISLDEHRDNDLIFLVNLVYVSPPKPVDLEALFVEEGSKVKFVSEHLYPVSFLNNRYPIIAHVFRLHVPLHPNLLRSDGALDFYQARRDLVALLHRVFGEFRDCNGGLILKFEEQLSSLKSYFLLLGYPNVEVIEDFFYSLVPIEKQATLPFTLLRGLCFQFMEALSFRPTKPCDYYLNRIREGHHILMAARIPISSFQNTVRASFEALRAKFAASMSWSLLEIQGGLSLTILLDEHSFPEVEAFYRSLKHVLNQWSKQVAGYRVVRAALHLGATSLDPRLGSDESSSNLLRMLFEGLTRFNDKGEIAEGIAESITISDDKKQYRFILRPSLWNNGSPLSAHDFAYAWKKILSPSFSLSFAYFLYPIQNARSIKEGTAPMEELGVKVYDDYTLEVSLDHPTPYFLELLVHPLLFPVHRQIDQEFPQWPNEVGELYPCNGPFQLTANHPNYGYQLVKNPNYWNAEETSLDQMIFLCLSQNEAGSLFRQGKIDLIGDPFSPCRDIFFEQTEGERFVLSERTSAWCLLNTKQFPFNCVKFRLALSLAINREEIATQVYTCAEPAYSLLLSEHSQSHSPYANYDPDRARILLHEFLEERGMKLEDLPIFKLHYSSRSTNSKVIGYLKGAWEKILNIRFQVVDDRWSRLYQRFMTSDFQIGIIRWVSRFNDPIYNLNAFRYSSGVVNFSRWENPVFQKLLDQADQSSITSERQEWLKAAEEILNEELPVIPLVYPPYECIKRKGVNSSFLTRCDFRWKI